MPALDADIRARWEAEQTFERCGEARAGAPVFTFYEGPPTANGAPGIHHVLGRTIKDTFCRYKTMRGYFVDRKAGWDTHGLPVEIEVEKELGLKSREAIEAYGIAEYNAACRASVLRYKAQWDELTRRVGYWVDLDAPYVTFANEYIESVWHLLKKLWDAGLLYKGHKIHWYSPGSGTVLSSHEVSLGYQEVQDPSVTVRFALSQKSPLTLALSPESGGEGTSKTGTDPIFAAKMGSVPVYSPIYILAWTTTPWTLISNAGLAVGPDIDYVLAEKDGERLVLAAAAAERVLGTEHEVLQRFKGTDLAGLRYEPAFDHFADHPEADQAWRVVTADFVSTEDGTGIVHLAPAFGADDYAVGAANGLPLLNPIEPDGHFSQGWPLVGGAWFKDADKTILRDLKDRGLLFARATVVHNYPHDWRKGTPLMNYPVESWFVRTSAHKDELVRLNDTIAWHPAHVGSGRFGDWLENNVDWALSRHRYWGTPLPIWISDTDPEVIEVIGSIAELREKAGESVPADAELDLHRPYVDHITWPAPSNNEHGGTMRRVPEIIDVWFDSGAMPYAQWHYPFENAKSFKANFPADFICEGLDQTRGWFYTLHAIAALTEGSVAFKNVVVNGLLLDAAGEKMSKSKGNTVDPFAALDAHGADVIRWNMLAGSPPWDNSKYAERGLRETRTKVFGTLENIYAFFATYANIDSFDPASEAPPVAERPELDRWILSRLQTTAAEAVAALDAYNPTAAARAVERFIDECSNWYIRRSRERFWAGARAGDADASGTDKAAAYHTTLTCLHTVARLMAPIAPFFAEWLYANLRGNVGADESVHLADYPPGDTALVDPALERRMGLARAIVTNVLALRNQAGVNVRQPLSRILVVEEAGVARADVEAVAALIRDEVNVDAIAFVAGTGELVTRSAKPDFKRLGKRLGKLMQPVARAVAQLTPADIDSYIKEGGLTLTIAGHPLELDEADLLIAAEGVAGWLVGREDGVTVALDSTISDSLRQRGIAREAVNRIQRLRKQAGFHVADRIALEYAGDAAIAAAIGAHRDWVAGETLALAVTAAENPAGEAVEHYEIDGMDLTLGVARVAAAAKAQTDSP